MSSNKEKKYTGKMEPNTVLWFNETSGLYSPDGKWRFGFDVTSSKLELTKDNDDAWWASQKFEGQGDLNLTVFNGLYVGYIDSAGETKREKNVFDKMDEYGKDTSLYLSNSGVLTIQDTNKKVLWTLAKKRSTANKVMWVFIWLLVAAAIAVTVYYCWKYIKRTGIKSTNQPAGKYVNIL